MATQTTHLGLTLPTGTENILRQTLNDNFSAIDTAFGEGSFSHNRKANTTIGQNSVAMGGEDVEASGMNSYAEGAGTVSSGGNSSHAEGWYTKATNFYAHSEGEWTEASGSRSHAEGEHTKASGHNSHSEGSYTEARSNASHAEGWYTIAEGGRSHAGGIYNAENSFDFPEWVSGKHYTRGCLIKLTSGNNVSKLICMTENSDETFDWSKWHTATPSLVGSAYGLYAEMIGNGFAGSRSNARSLDWAGNEYLAGDLYVHCEYDGTGGTKVTTMNDIGTDVEFAAMLSDYYS